MYMVQNRKNDFGIVKTVMFLCIMAILCSCKDTKKILTRNSYQYWHYIDSKQNEDETRHPYFCREDSFYFYVDSKGVFIEFRANWRFREYNGFLVSHYLYEPSWNLLNRNTIRFGRFRYKIISVSDNRILIRNDIDPKNAVDTLELVPKSHIPKDYRDFQKPFQYKEEKKDREKGKYFFKEYSVEDGKKLINILNSAPSEVESSIQKFPVSAISMGNMKLQACLSDDHQFVATQLLAFKDFGYQPVTEMVTYTGKTAEAFAQLF